jgi:SAM-dependent methyltransferase
MLPPETTATIGPRPARPLIAAATDPTSALLRHHAALTRGPIDLPMPVRLEGSVALPLLMQLKEEVDHTATDARIDVEQRRVDFARQQYAPIPFDRCRPDGLDLPDASFDIVLSIVVLPFVPDDNAYMQEIRRVLRPGGHLVVATKTSPFLSRIWRRLSGQRERDRHPSPGIRHHDAGDAADLLRRHRFEILRERAFYDPPFEARQNAVDLVNGVFATAGEPLGLVATAPYPLFLARRAD